MSNNAYLPRRTAWAPTWNGNGLGTVYKVQPDIDVVMEDIKRASTGKMPLGKWITHLDGVVKIQLADLTRVIQENLTPWWSGTTGVTSIPLVPMGMNTNIYQYAQELILHPVDLGTNLKEDLHLIKAVPLFGKRLKIDREGEKDDMWEVDFCFFPDLSRVQASPAVVVYGYIGDTAI